MLWPSRRRPNPAFDGLRPDAPPRLKVSVRPNVHEAGDRAGNRVHRSQQRGELDAPGHRLPPGFDSWRQTARLEFVRPHFVDGTIAARADRLDEGKRHVSVHRRCDGEVANAEGFPTLDNLAAIGGERSLVRMVA